MRHRLVALCAACLLVAVAAPAAAVHDTGEQLVVSLDADGDATVVEVTDYDLTNETERNQFERLESNETARQQRAADFRSYLEDGAALASERTDRDVTAGEVTVNLTRANETGTVRLRGSWTNLAAANDARVTVTEPFASGLPVNRSLVVRGPDGYVRHATNPAPGRALRNSAFWGQQADLTDFRATFADPEAATATATDAPEQRTPTAGPVTPDGLVRVFGAASLAAVPALLFAFAFRREER